METKLYFKNFEPTEQLKQYANSRFKKLEKYIKRTDNSILQINFSVEKHRQIAETILQADDIHLTAQEETEDMYATIDGLLDKLEAQLKKNKGQAKRKTQEKKSQKYKL